MRGEGGRGVSDDFGYVTIILPDPPQGSVIYSFSLKHTSANIFLVFTISKFYRKIVFFYLENCGSITYVYLKKTCK